MPNRNTIKLINIDKYEKQAAYFTFFLTAKFGAHFKNNFFFNGKRVYLAYVYVGFVFIAHLTITFGRIASGRTSGEIEGNKMQITISFKRKNDVGSYIETMCHESFLHADKYSVDFSHNGKIDFSAGIDRDIVDSNKFTYSSFNSKVGDIHHWQERRDRVLEQKGVPIMQKYYRSIGLTKSREEIIQSFYSYSD
ncbi:MAG: hypothetical protein JJU02_00090 [Cryomorphaceae bacterium]|nr:hypothetical protein [Cryomorphaceae bacterium]